MFSHVIVNECKVKWNYLLSLYISNLQTLSSSSGTKNKIPYNYITEAMGFMLPLVKTPDTSVEHLSEYFQQPTLESTQCRPNSTLNVLNTIEKKEDIQLERHVAINSLSPSSSAQLLTTSTQKQETDIFHEKVPNNDSTLNTTLITGKSQKRTITDVDGSLTEPEVNMKNYRITMNSSECSLPERKLFLLGLLPKIELMTDSQMSLFERGVKQIIDGIINPSSYRQLPLPSNYSPTGSLVLTSNSLPSMDQYSSMGQYSCLGQYSYVGQYPLSLPTFNQMPNEQQRHNYTQ